MAAVQRWRWVQRVNALCLHPWSKPLLFALVLWPAGSLLWAAVFDQLGANPAEALLRATGEWTLRLLCVARGRCPPCVWPCSYRPWRSGGACWVCGFTFTPRCTC
ncbi:sulfoxide reductase heme-binding subunit yedZ [Rhodoferax antarcticus ANT.BR]|uniref:Sulfoxide reductase heme-binding subunit yedZ n=1 Tax=Rhodoferax antarcticus ANT.BR TaxID=1111071 RepID=A0A1Q8YL05_9BURK|nr:sulfoxide reductase heme-binding subunit yedZ [Rhodoferax antarcticus ANT.BR]